MFAVVDWPLAEARDSHVRYGKEYWKSFGPLIDGRYTNEVSDPNKGKVDDNYQGNYERLPKVKNQYDPGNLFHLNAKLKPTV